MIQHDNTPLPESRAGNYRNHNTKWIDTFRSIQLTGERRKLVGEFTHSEQASIRQSAMRHSDRDFDGYSFGKIKVNVRTRLINPDTKKYTDRYMYEIWVTVPHKSGLVLEHITLADPTTTTEDN